MRPRLRNLAGQRIPQISLFVVKHQVLDRITPPVNMEPDREVEGKWVMLQGERGGTLGQDGLTIPRHADQNFARAAALLYHSSRFQLVISA